MTKKKESSKKHASEPKARPENEAPEESAQPSEAEAQQRDADSVATSLAADLNGLQAELEEAQNRALRTSAELENYRRRATRQMEEERKYAHLDLFRDLLPIWDNMGRAVDAAEKAGEADALLEGFKMVQNQLESVFERYQCVKIEAEGRPFDPNLHEAISQMPSADHPPGTVLHVAQVGFRLHDRVVRPCQVVVSSAPPEAETDEKSDQAEEEES